MSDPHKVVIVGGGAGGLELATSLGRRFGKRNQAEITLIDRSPTHLWKPLLHEVASGTLDSNDDELSYPSIAYQSHFRFLLGPMEGIDREKKTVAIGASHDDDGIEFLPARDVAYDTLVIAIGSQSNDFGVDGVAEHCHFLDSRAQADRFHRKLLFALYRANAQQEPLRPGQLHIAVAGAGATGVELIAELHDSLNRAAEYALNNIDPMRDVKFHLIEAADRVLPHLPERISEKSQRLLEQLDIDIHTGERIVRADADGYYTESGKTISAEIKVWAAGIKAPEVLATLGLKTTRLNQLLVRPTLQVEEDDSIFAIGDCAACPMGDAWVPPRAQAAHQQAELLAKSIAALLRGDSLPEYEYNDYGSLVNLSQQGTVGTLMGNLMGKFGGRVFIEGMMARFAYWSLYKMHQLAVKGPLRVAATTAADMITHHDNPRLKLH